MARPSGRPLRDELVTEAKTLIQQVGVGGFSYGGLAERLGISSPSIHHHFRTKEDLVAEVAARYRADFAHSVAALDGSSASERLVAYTGLYADAASREMLCLCGAVAAEWMTIGDKPKAVVEGFFADQSSWLMAQLDGGVASGELRRDLDVSGTALALLAALEGAMLLARANGDSTLVSSACSTIVDLAVRPS